MEMRPQRQLPLQFPRIDMTIPFRSDAVNTLYAGEVPMLLPGLILPGFMHCGEFVQFSITGVPGGRNIPIGYCAQNGTARLLKMGTVVEAAMSQIRAEFRKVVLKFFLFNLIDHFNVEGGKTRRIGSKRVSPEVV